MSVPEGFLVGVIEGFYGRAWPFDVRQSYAAYLQHAGLNTYLYCPKGDPYLRRHWRESWPKAQFRQLLELGECYSARGIDWGVGLSPFELYVDYGPAERDALQRKIEEIARLQAPLLAVLFDDMPGDLDCLAERQAEIVADVEYWLPATRLLVCPTYYTFDPVLERHFGAMPRDYWPRLGRNLSDRVEIFWTGNEVCSESIECGDIEAITALLGRRVLLWDNYPVNDGAVRSKHLYTSPLAARSVDMAASLAGHLCNPMNQPLLSLPALSGLARLYGAAGFSAADLAEILGPATCAELEKNREEFQFVGLEGMGRERCRELADTYRTLAEPGAGEIAAWLQGEYRFDPACLTD